MRTQDLTPDQVEDLRSLIRRSRAGALVLQCRLRGLGLDAEADAELARAERLEQLGEELGERGPRVLAAR